MILMTEDELDQKLIQHTNAIIAHLDSKKDEMKWKESSDLVTYKEAQLLLRISKPTLSKMKKAGVIPFVKFGKRVLFLKAEVIALIENRKIVGKK